MQDMTRRAAIATAIAAPAAAALTQLAPGYALAQQGEAAADQGQAPGFYRHRVGDLVVTRILDGQFQRPTEGFVSNARTEEVDEALRDAFMPPGAVTIPLTFIAVQGGGRTVLIDTGTGGKAGPTANHGARNMAAAGLDPAQVDMVVISHFHPDHIGGLTSGDGKAAFAKAEILVPEAEWAFWMDEGAMSRAPEAMQGVFQLVRTTFSAYGDRVRPYGANAEVAGLQAGAAPGHTPGHTVFTIASGDQQLMVLSDITNHPALFVRNPGWHAIFDMDPAQAEQSRRRVLDRAAADRVPVAGYHYPFPGIGHIRQREAGYEFEPAQWSSEF